MENLQQIVLGIENRCLDRELTPFEAVNEIDRTIGGITSVIYKEGTKFKIYNHNAIFSLDVNGIRKKEQEYLQGLAVLGYSKAQKNGSLNPGEIHISENASTKHHKEGIYRILNKYS